MTIEGPRRFWRRGVGPGGPVTLHVSADEGRDRHDFSRNRTCIPRCRAIGAKPVACITSGEQSGRRIGQIVANPLVVGDGPPTRVEPQFLASGGANDALNRRIKLPQVGAVGDESVDVELPIARLELGAPRQSEAIDSIVGRYPQAESEWKRNR